LVLPADMNPIEAEEVAQCYLEADTDTLIVTRLELSKRCGVPLRAAYQGLKLTLVSKSPELVEGLQCATPEIMLEKMLAACEISL
jgi:D-ribose pyranose/furanose isomerase RbsD